MRIRLVKWLCIAALFVSFVLWQWIASYEFLLKVFVSLGAGIVAVQAFHSGRNRWTMCFISIALLFNPAIPIFPLANTLGLLAIALTAAAFAVSLAKVKSQPLLSIPSITDRNPARQRIAVIQIRTLSTSIEGGSRSKGAFGARILGTGSTLCRRQPCG